MSNYNRLNDKKDPNGFNSALSDKELIEKLGWRNDSMSYAILSLGRHIKGGEHDKKTTVTHHFHRRVKHNGSV